MVNFKDRLRKVFLSLISVVLGILLSYSYYLYKNNETIGEIGLILLGFAQAIILVFIIIMIFNK